MTDHLTHDSESPPQQEHASGHGGHGGHGWMMIVCCIPMLAIAIGLVAAGVASAGFLFWAVACTAMMALMMRGMNHGASDADKSTHAGHGRPDGQ